MKLSEFERVAELCNLIGIKTLADLRVFEESHEMNFVYGQNLINALEKELKNEI